MEDANDLVKTLLRLAKVSECFSHKDHNDCLRLSVALQRFSGCDWQNAITDNAAEIIVTAYIQDGWGCDAQTQHVHLSDSYIVRRSRKMSWNFTAEGIYEDF